jgi:cytochrome P450
MWITKKYLPLEFRPQRWIVTSDTGTESLFMPQPGTFLAWSSGPRICPGMKFSHVKFVAVISTILARHDVSTAISRWKMRVILAQSSEGPTLSMRDGNKVVLQLEEI